MKIIAIVIGHGPRIDKGAENKDGTTELAWNRDLAELIGSAVGKRADVRIVQRVKERLQPVKETNATNAAIAVELHLNSATGRASGTEMIHAPRSKRGKALARVLQAVAVRVLKLPDRGVKPPFKGRGLRWVRDTKMPAVMIESFFIDNSADLARGNERKQALAKAYADALVTFALQPS